MSSATDFTTLGRLGTTGDGAPKKRPASRRRKPVRRSGPPGSPVARTIKVQVIAGVVVAVIAVLFFIGLAVGNQTGGMSAVTLASPVLDPSLEATLRTGAAQQLSTSTVTLTPGGGSDIGSLEAPQAFAAVEDVALHLPYTATQDIIFMEADNAAALPLVPVGAMTRNANPEGFQQDSEFEGPPFTVATPMSGVRPATGMVALLTAPGMPVLAPVQGVVTAVGEYTAEDGTTDWRVAIQPTGRSDLQVVIRRIDAPSVVPGQEVSVGVTSIGIVRGGAVVDREHNELALPSALIHVRPATSEEETPASP